MPIATSLSRIASALEAQNTDDAAKREQDDLNAQMSMAHWAKMVFWAAFAQAFLSLVGIVLIFITFQQTRRAADAADLMVKESTAATKAAQEAVDVTRLSAVAAKEAAEVSTAAQRPWVKASVEITEVRLDMEEGSSAFIESKVALENVGKSPAILDRWSETRAVLCRRPLLGSSRRIAEIQESARNRQPASLVKGRVPIFPGEVIRHYGSSVASFRPDEPRPAMPPEVSHIRLPDDGPDYAIYMAVDLTYAFVGGAGNTRVYYEVRGKEFPLTRRKAPYTADELRIERLDFYTYAD